MSKHGSIRRYSLIIEKIAKKQYPSFENIKAFLYDQGFEDSDRTIQRAIEQIRYDFGLEITYDHSERGYFINEQETFNIESFVRFLEIANTADLLSETLMDSKDALNFIEFENVGELKGLKYLKDLLLATRKNRKISFTYKRFDAGDESNYQLMPYLLKEYQSRWYIIGISEQRQSFRTFGIDRITSLKVSDETFVRDPKSTPQKLFKNTIGLTYSENNEEEVVLSFTPFQGNYIKTLPWHRTQQIVTDNEQELRIKLDIVINFEFTQKVLMHGETVTVIQPEWFAKEIQQRLKNTLKKYN